jgi:hypothetical protein
MRFIIHILLFLVSPPQHTHHKQKTYFLRQIISFAEVLLFIIPLKDKWKERSGQIRVSRGPPIHLLVRYWYGDTQSQKVKRVLHM